jgi:hypothetical protein
VRFPRLFSLLAFLFAIGAACIAQNQDQDQSQNKETNFSTGPQYLANFGSPLFLRPISTPSLSLEPAPAAPPESQSQPATATGVQPVPGPAQVPNMLRVYYGGPTESAPEAAIEAVEANEGEVQQSEAPESEIEISSANTPATLPASIVNVGVTEILDARSLRERGYGMGVGESAAFWKAHKLHGVRVFTNADVSRLHGG